MGKSRRPMEETCGIFFRTYYWSFLDGDNRRRMLMLKDYYSTRGMTYQIPLEGWRLTRLYDGFKVTGIHAIGLHPQWKKYSESFV